MPYNLFLTMRRSNEFSKAKVVYAGQGGEAFTVLSVEDCEFLTPEEVLSALLGAVAEHMKVRRDGQRRG